MTIHWLAISTKEMDSINAEIAALRAKCERLEADALIVEWLEKHWPQYVAVAREALAQPENQSTK